MESHVSYEVNNNKHNNNKTTTTTTTTTINKPNLSSPL